MAIQARLERGMQPCTRGCLACADVAVNWLLSQEWVDLLVYVTHRLCV